MLLSKKLIHPDLEKFLFDLFIYIVILRDIFLQIFVRLVRLRILIPVTRIQAHYQVIADIEHDRDVSYKLLIISR